MGNSVSRRHAAHFDSYIPGLGTVVDLGQKVAMDVDHDVFTTFNNLNKSICNTTIRTHPAAKHRRPSAACLSQPVWWRGFAPLARGEASSPHLRIQPKGFAEGCLRCPSSQITTLSGEARGCEFPP